MGGSRAKELNRAFGKRVAKLRRQRGWTLEQLAEKTGLTKPRLLRIETGEGQVTLRIIGCFVKAFNAMPGEILNRLL